MANGSDFEIQYSQAEAQAQAIIKIADQMKDTFDSMDSVMTTLGSHWESKGATEVIDMYNNIAAAYPGIHNKIVEYANDIKTVSNNDQTGDMTASKIVETK